jgi:hypothetical protein
LDNVFQEILAIIKKKVRDGETWVGFSSLMLDFHTRIPNYW